MREPSTIGLPMARSNFRIVRAAVNVVVPLAITSTSPMLTIEINDFWQVFEGTDSWRMEAIR
jgi:hypothetical protein